MQHARTALPDTLPRLPILTLILTLALAAGLSAQVKPVSPIPDDPGGRGRANREWFGIIQPDYLDFKGRVAEREVSRWGRTFPKPTLLTKGAPARALAAGSPVEALAPATQAAAVVAPLTWVNLGPFTDTHHGRDVDSGRPASIVALANHVLLLATSGGGVFRCANADPATTADWVWEAVTDSLPASSATGNVAVGALAASPDGLTLFLGLGDDFDATGRGFYRSTDLGTTWTTSSLGANNATTRVYAILPLASGAASTVLLGTDDGLKRSVDGGATFVRVAGALGSGMIWSLQKLSPTELIASREDPAPPNGTGAGTLYYSSDGGATWAQAVLDASVTSLATSTSLLRRITLATSPASPNQAWGIAQVASPTDASVPDRIAPGLLSSADKGHSWTFVNAATTLFKGTGDGMADDGKQGFYNHMIAVSPLDANRLVVGANLATYRTLDAGKTWTQLTDWTGKYHAYAHADNHCSAWSPDSQTLYVGNDGGISVFKNPWSASIPVADDTSFVDNGRNRGLATHLVYHLGSTQAANTGDGPWRISLGCQDDGTRIRQGSGAALQTSGDFQDAVGGDGFGTLIHPMDANQMLASVYYAEVYRSANGGAFFAQSITGLVDATDKDKAPFITRLAQGWADPTGNTVYTFTNGTVFRSPDFGQNWNALGRAGLPVAGANAASEPSDVLYLRQIGAARSDANVVGVVANGGRVFLTTNSGATWTQASALPGSSKNLSYLSFDPLDSRTFYVASVAPDSAANHLWKTTNGGTTFTPLDGSATVSNGFPWGIPVHIVVPDAKVARRLFAGTDFGVYQSVDAGANWTRLGTGLPLVAARDLYLAPDGSFLRAGTYGRGVWEINLGGLQVTLGPGATTLLPSAKATYSATVTGFQSNSQVTWSDGQAGGNFSPAITASGASTTYTAPAATTLVTLTAASLEQPATLATLPVAIYNPATLAVSVTPAGLVLVGPDATTYQAAVTGAPTPAVAWSCSAGTITAAGVFTAPALSLGTQTVTITATSPYAGPNRAGTATATVKSLDLNANGSAGLDDLAFLAYAFGTATPAAKLSSGTLVDDGDLTAFLAHF